MGADYVEPDLQLTRDGVFACLHDAAPERTTEVALRVLDRAVVALAVPVDRLVC